MRTKMTIMAIVLANVLASIAVLVGLMIALGPWGGLGVGLGSAAVAVTVYRVVLQPWHARWGATDEEIGRAMPGDAVLPEAASTTRAITIGASSEQIWPWLVQIGYGRAGWYSYDWIDNDWKPSADRILPKLQSLEVGDRILMVPGMGPEVKEIEEDRYILSSGEADTWCLALYPSEGETRLVSRWRQNWPNSLATYFWIAISDPGAFIMERKMLKGIKRRVEASAGREPEENRSG